MLRPSLRILAAGTLLPLIFAVAPARSQDSAKAPSKDAKLLKDVSTRLLAVCPKVEGLEWPPDVDLDADPKINAYASIYEKQGKKYGMVRVTNLMMSKVILGDPDRLAFVVGHELGHIIRKHPGKQADKGMFLKITFTRDQEDEADKIGSELMVEAGFSFEKGMKAITRMQDLGLDYSSFEGLGVDHPTWNDRAAKIDKEKAGLWKVSSAFTNGVCFLMTEQYDRAEMCFDFVTKDYPPTPTFPGCHEAWANLGYARLMRYCDMLDAKDLQKFGIGQIITGGFYQRAETIKVRGIDVKLWKAAVAALTESNRIKPKQSLVLANLGLCYLVHPEGKDVGEALNYLSAAAKAAREDKSLDRDPVAYAALLVNLGVASVAKTTTPQQALAEVDLTEQAVHQLPDKRLLPACDTALLYTRALVQSESKERIDLEKARGLFEQYLGKAAPQSFYWESAYARYEAVSKTLHQEAKPKASFSKRPEVKQRLVTSVTLANGRKISLGDDREDLEKLLGKGAAIRVVPGQNLWRLRYEELGVEVLAGDNVVAVVLKGPNAPAVPLRAQGLAAPEAGQAKIGMSEEDIVKLMGEYDYRVELTEAKVYYNYYRDQGMAVLVRGGQVREIVVVQVPEAKVRTVD